MNNTHLTRQPPRPSTTHTYRVTDTGPLTLDVHAPDDSTDGSTSAAVILVTGFSDAGAIKRLGSPFKDTEFFVSWARRFAASGLAAIAYENRDPESDLLAVIDYVRRTSGSLGIDGSRLGLWACSGHVPNALAALMTLGRDSLRCAALFYGYMLDSQGNAVAEAAAQFGFVVPTSGKTVVDLPPDLPLFIARAGGDHMPGLNESVDRFVCAALRANLPVTVINHPNGPHAFDLCDDSPMTREIVRRALTFLRFHVEGR